MISKVKELLWFISPIPPNTAGRHPSQFHRNYKAKLNKLSSSYAVEYWHTHIALFPHKPDGHMSNNHPLFIVQSFQTDCLLDVLGSGMMKWGSLLHADASHMVSIWHFLFSKAGPLITAAHWLFFFSEQTSRPSSNRQALHFFLKNVRNSLTKQERLILW